MKEYDTAVIGGGPAGMAAAIEASQAGARVILIERAPALGGILNQCTHSGFGLSYFGEELTGPQYARRFVDKLTHTDAEILTDTTVVDIRADGVLTLSGSACGFIQISAKAVILASGCRERAIGSIMVSGTRPAGVFTAGAAQKMINLGGYTLGKRFVILGSGDVGMIAAREIARRGCEVVAVIEKEERCGGLLRNRIECLEKYKIPLRTRQTMKTIHGRGRVTGVTVCDLSGGGEYYIACDTLITSLGLIPERELLDDISAGGKQLPGRIFLCGNACYVHDTADDVSLESEKVGRLAAQYAGYGSAVLEHGSGSKSHVKTSNDESMVCIGCPKACSVAQDGAGAWHGLKCGRSIPATEKKAKKDEKGY